jgi:hypothetical protein
VRNLQILAIFWALGLVLGAVTPGQAIDAVRGKNYTLTKEHGPWMVMVASFRNVPKDRRNEGLSAEEAAIELVYELRERGIPAYTYSQGAVVEKIDTIDRLGREDERIYAAQRDMICVLAGNWNSIDDKEAQKALASIKKFYPKFMKDKKSGAIFRETPGQKGPLGGAFMTINPLLSAEEVARRKPDPEVVRMNTGSSFALIGSRKNYTVRVATFTGKHSMQMRPEAFDRKLQDRTSYGLNQAGEDAEQLAAALRKNGVEAYVHHDRYQSIVTVGAFDTPSDPLVTQIRRDYWPQHQPDPLNPRETKLQPKTLIVPRSDNPNDIPLVWAFDMEPRVIPVPKYK